MLFILFVFIWSAIHGIVIKDFSSLGKGLNSMDNVPCLIIAIVILIFYGCCYFCAEEKEDEDDLNKTAIIALAVYGVMWIIIGLIMSNLSEHNCDILAWAYIVVWPIVTLGVMLISGKIHEFSWLYSLCRFFNLELRMLKYAIRGTVFMFSISLILFFPAAMYADSHMGGDYRF